MSTNSTTPEEPHGLWPNIRALLALSDQRRTWGFLLTVALAVGAPVLLGVWLGQLAHGVSASIGGLASLYLRQTPLPHRMVTMALVTFGFCVSFTLTLLAGFSPWAQVAALGTVAFAATFITRYFAVPAPGSFFFILVACIASAMPYELAQLPERAGLMLFGCMGATLLALGYSLLQRLGEHPPFTHPAEPTEPRVVAILLEAATIGLVVALSYSVALWLGFDKPYWVPISCAAIMQGASFRAVWQRKVHRVVGTAIGMGLAWLIFTLDPGPWSIALYITLLSFIIEWLVTRNYGLAVIFITPLTILLAEAESVSHETNLLIQMRMTDVLLGSTMGYLGGWLLHQRELYAALERRFMTR